MNLGFFKAQRELGQKSFFSYLSLDPLTFLYLLSVGVLITPVAPGMKNQLSLTHSFKPLYHLLTSLFESTSPKSVIGNSSLFSLNPVNKGVELPPAFGLHHQPM